LIHFAQVKRSIKATTIRKRPPVVIDSKNMAAKCIEAQSNEYNVWTRSDHCDDPVMSERLLGTTIYIQVGSSFDIMKKFT